MELKVWVEGIQRIVCGVTETTTCQDVVFALAHATGKVGRFTLIERWRSNERLLAPNENPLKILMKWGEYSSDVQFILQRSDQIKSDPTTAAATATATAGAANQPKNQSQSQPLQQQQQNEHHRNAPNHQQSSSVPYAMPSAKSPPPLLSNNTNTTTTTTTTPTTVQIKEAKGFGSPSESKPFENIGIVKGIPQMQQQQHLYASPKHSPNNSISTDPGSSSVHSKSTIEFNSADIRNSLDRKTSLFREARNLSSESLIDAYNLRITADLYKNGPPISSNGALVPPPYRDPPPPRTSPLHQKSDSIGKPKKFDYNKDDLTINSFGNLNELDENTFQSSQYRDLIQLIKFQRDKITTQQADLNKYDAEIVYLESKERDHVQQMDALTREIGKTDKLYRQGTEQLQTLQYVEEENELVRQQEKTLKSEITLLRSKLANCETELLQCKNKIRLIMDDIQIEQRNLSRQFDNRHQLEKHFLSEVERLQTEIDQAIQHTETTTKTTENLRKEVAVIETAIAEKKKQVEQLVNEMKEVNLQSLAVAPSDEIRHLLEGSNRPGSTRRIIGSPRQLETAVPTSKNPHGVWV